MNRIWNKIALNLITLKNKQKDLVVLKFIKDKIMNLDNNYLIKLITKRASHYPKLIKLISTKTNI